MSRGQTTRAAPDLGAVLGERYQLVRFLGAGGMGAVYEAATPEGTRVAVKVLHEIPSNAMGRELLARFEREAKVTAALAHPHVLSRIDSGVDALLNIPYIVMPLMSGLDVAELIDRVDRVGPLHPTVAVRILR
jgi:serine/threonine-protein kinase